MRRRGQRAAGGLSDGESDKLRHAREAMEQGAANLARAFPIGGSHRAQSAALLQLVESLKGHGARGGAGDRLSQLVELSPKVDSGVARLASVGRENARAELGEKTASQQGGGGAGSDHGAERGAVRRAAAGGGRAQVSGRGVNETVL